MGRLIPVVVGVALGLAAVFWALQDPATPQAPSGHPAGAPLAMPTAPPAEPVQPKRKRLAPLPALVRDTPHRAPSPATVADRVDHPLPSTVAPIPPPDPDERDAGPNLVPPDTGATAALDPEDAKSAIALAKPEIGKCYEQVLEQTPDAAGTIVAKFTLVHKDGEARFDAAEIVSNDFENPFFGMCVLNALAGLEFPVPEGGDGTIVIRYPFRMTPAATGEEK